MKTKIEIIEETANYYNDSNRSVNNDGECVYIGQDGAMCAFSRCCNENSRGYLLAVDNRRLSAHKGVGSLEDPESLLKEEYKGHSLRFWKDIQRFHDDDENWNEYGITESGIKELEKLKKLWE
jgi:hypothetical protein